MGARRSASLNRSDVLEISGLAPATLCKLDRGEGAEISEKK
jgi:hypothetical protein